MDLEFSDEQEMLRETVRRVCAESASLEVVREMEDHPTGFPPELWKQLGELGLTGMRLPESAGGAALGTVELAIVYEELGRALAPSPLFASSLLCAGALESAGSDSQRQQWLPGLASGEAIWVPAWLEPDNGFGPQGIQLRAAQERDRYRLDGTKLYVPFAAAATRLLVLARTGNADDEIDLFLVDPDAPGVRMTQQRALGSETQYRIELEGVEVSTDSRIGAPGSGWKTWNEQMTEGVIALAAQAVGGAARALEITVAYAKERQQFGKPLGAFQALSHYLADGATEIDGARTLVYQAAWAHAQGRKVQRLAPMAKLMACQAYRDFTDRAQQIFGGVGFTIEYDIQLFFRRAKQLQITWWDSPYLEEMIAADLLEGNDPL